MTLRRDEQQRLDEDGFLLLETFIDQQLLRKLSERIEQLLEEEGELAGLEFKQEPGCRRLANPKWRRFAFVVAILVRASR